MAQSNTINSFSRPYACLITGSDHQETFKCSLNQEQALQYLHKETLANVDVPGNSIPTHLRIGWINGLGNRINNLIQPTGGSSWNWTKTFHRPANNAWARQRVKTPTQIAPARTFKTRTTPTAGKNGMLCTMKFPWDAGFSENPLQAAACNDNR